MDTAYSEDELHVLAGMPQLIGSAMTVAGKTASSARPLDDWTSRR